MLTVYRPGTGWLHRMPAGAKILLLLALVFGISLLPSAWWAAGVATGVSVVAYATAALGDGMLGMKALWRQVLSVRWLVAVTFATQLLFLGAQPAVANTARVTVAIVLAALLTLTTQVTTLLDAVERGLRPLARLGIDPQRCALLLTVTLSTIPSLARLARDVRDAQRSRGSRGSLRTFVFPFLVVALKHADQLGDALTARGVR